MIETIIIGVVVCMIIATITADYSSRYDDKMLGELCTKLTIDTEHELMYA